MALLTNGGGWRIRYNDELYNRCPEDQGAEVEVAGHMYRMDSDAPARKCLFTKPDGRGGRLKPRRRLLDAVEDDLTDLTDTNREPF